MGFTTNVESKVPNRSVMNLDYKNRTSLQFDFLYPTCIKEALPKDKFKLNTANIARFAPQMAPSFGDLKFYTHWFYVPRRIVEPRWKEFYCREEEFGLNKNKSLRVIYSNQFNSTYSRTGAKTTQTNVYSKDGTIFGKQSLADYFGLKPLPEGDSASQRSGYQAIDATPFMAYQYIYNEYYRDSEIDEDLFKTGNALWYLTREGWTEFIREHQQGGRWYGARGWNIDRTQGTKEQYYDYILNGVLPFTTYDRTLTLAANANFEYESYEHIITELFTLRKRAWYHDYFTNATTTLTSGEMPIVPVKFQSRSDTSVSVDKELGSLWVNTNSTGGDSQVLANNSGESKVSNAKAWNLGFTISQLRLANALTKYEEKTIRFGTRYLEQLASHFGVISSDASLQRPLFLGGSQGTVYSNEVTQTSASTAESAQGNYAGQMIALDMTNKTCVCDCEEHGWIFALTSIMCKASYGDGLHKMWTRNSDPINFYSPEFAELTDQTIRLRELYTMDKITANNREVNPNRMEGDSEWGYVARWDEYRGSYDTFTGQMRDKLRYWHFGRRFANLTDLYYGPSTETSVGAKYDSNTGTYKYVFRAFKINTKPFTEYNEWDIPLSFVTFNRELNEEEKTHLRTAGNDDNYIIVEVVVPSQSAMNWEQMIVRTTKDIINIPMLNTKFIRSNVPLVPFALTDEFENIGNDYDNKLMGDDYIFANIANNITAIRPMPEQAIPRL